MTTRDPQSSSDSSSLLTPVETLIARAERTLKRGFHVTETHVGALIRDLLAALTTAQARAETAEERFRVSHELCVEQVGEIAALTEQLTTVKQERDELQTRVAVLEPGATNYHPMRLRAEAAERRNESMRQNLEAERHRADAFEREISRIQAGIAELEKTMAAYVPCNVLNRAYILVTPEEHRALLHRLRLLREAPVRRSGA